MMLAPSSLPGLLHHRMANRSSLGLRVEGRRCPHRRDAHRAPRRWQRWSPILRGKAQSYSSEAPFACA